MRRNLRANPAEDVCSPWWTAKSTAGACAWVVFVAFAIRAICLVDLPLLVTNDSTRYLCWGQQLLRGESPQWPPFRTPGYPAFLATLFWAAGPRPWPVLIAQHALGVISAGLVAALGSRFGGPRAGLVCGLLAAFDPTALMFESYALTESVSVSHFLIAAAVALLAPPRLPVAGGLGLVLAWLCLTRPAFQIVVPFFAFALAVRGGRCPRKILACVLTTAATLLVACTPWLISNARRGIPGLSGSNGVYLWIGVTQAGLLDLDYPMPEPVRAAADRTLVPDPALDARLHRFLIQIDGWRERRPVLRDWALHSIAAAPARYLRAAVTAGLWQLDIHPSAAATQRSETAWLAARLGRRGGGERPNFSTDMSLGDLGNFAMHGSRGPAAWFMRRFGTWQQPGLLRAPFFLACSALVVWSLRRGRWDLALVFGSSLAYWAVHAAFLLYNSRYSLPCWELWLVSPAALIGLRSGRVKAMWDRASGPARGPVPPPVPAASGPGSPAAG